MLGRAPYAGVLCYLTVLKQILVYFRVRTVSVPLVDFMCFCSTQNESSLYCEKCSNVTSNVSFLSSYY